MINLTFSTSQLRGWEIGLKSQAHLSSSGPAVILVTSHLTCTQSYSYHSIHSKGFRNSMPGYGTKTTYCTISYYSLFKNSSLFSNNFTCYFIPIKALSTTSNTGLNLDEVLMNENMERKWERFSPLTILRGPGACTSFKSGPQLSLFHRIVARAHQTIAHALTLACHLLV